jgi:hypothetical protein
MFSKIVGSDTGIKTSPQMPIKNSIIEKDGDEGSQAMRERKNKVEQEESSIAVAFKKAIDNKSFTKERPKGFSFYDENNNNSEEESGEESENDTESDDQLKMAIPKRNETKKEERKDEEEEQGEKEETKDKEKQTQAVDENLTEEEKKHLESLNLSAEDLKTRTGQSISLSSREGFDRLRASAAYFKKELDKLRTNKTGIDEAEFKKLKKEYDDIKGAHTELKKRWEDKYFEETDEWKQHYVNPVVEAANEASKWMKGHDLEENSEELREMAALEATMNKALREQDEMKYVEAADTISDFLKKGARARFLQSAEKLWESFKSQQEAFKDKDAARKEVTAKVGGFVDRSTKEAAAAIDDGFRRFEEVNHRVVDAYKNNPKYREFMQYDNVVANVGNAKNLIEMTIRERRVSPALIDMVLKGAMHDLKLKEQEAHLARIEMLEQERERLLAKLDEKNETINRVRPSKKKASASSEESSEESLSLAERFRERFGRR